MASSGLVIVQNFIGGEFHPTDGYIPRYIDCFCVSELSVHRSITASVKRASVYIGGFADCSD
jgi:hypothetical protein